MTGSDGRSRRDSTDSRDLELLTHLLRPGRVSGREEGREVDGHRPQPTCRHEATLISESGGLGQDGSM